MIHCRIKIDEEAWLPVDEEGQVIDLAVREGWFREDNGLPS